MGSGDGRSSQLHTPDYLLLQSLGVHHLWHDPTDLGCSCERHIAFQLFSQDLDHSPESGFPVAACEAEQKWPPKPDCTSTQGKCLDDVRPSTDPAVHKYLHPAIDQMGRVPPDLEKCNHRGLGAEDVKC